MARISRIISCIGAAALCAILPAALSACSSQVNANGTTTVNFTAVVTDSKNAYKLIASEADQLVAQGKLDAKTVSDAEAAATSALAVLESTDGTVTLTAQDAAQTALNALTTLGATLPAADLPASVSTGLSVAEGVLAAFIALDPASANAVTLHREQLTVPAPASLAS